MILKPASSAAPVHRFVIGRCLSAIPFHDRVKRMTIWARQPMAAFGRKVFAERPLDLPHLIGRI
jgi:hypothetical protein